APTLPVHFHSSSARFPLHLSLLSPFLLKPYCSSFSTFWSNRLLVFCSTVVARSHSNGYKLVTVVAVVSCQQLIVALTATSQFNFKKIKGNYLKKKYT
ncbi:unnamed protein product, partial [Hymenolepis diminuta]